MNTQTNTRRLNYVHEAPLSSQNYTAAELLFFVHRIHRPTHPKVLPKQAHWATVKFPEALQTKEAG